MSFQHSNRRPIEEMSHREASDELLGQVVRFERDRANRNNDAYSADVKMQSAMIHALLAVEEQLQRVANIISDK